MFEVSKTFKNKSKTDWACAVALFTDAILAPNSNYCNYENPFSRKNSNVLDTFDNVTTITQPKQQI